jgi:hypothetical protein
MAILTPTTNRFSLTFFRAHVLLSVGRFLIWGALTTDTGLFLSISSSLAVFLS